MLEALDVHSIAFEPLTIDELRQIRALGRLDRSFDGLVGALVRIQFIRATTVGVVGRHAERGLAIVEATLLCLLAAEPAADERQLRCKAVLFRCADDTENAAAMLCAALESDSRRLGLLPAEAPVVDVFQTH